MTLNISFHKAGPNIVREVRLESGGRLETRLPIPRSFPLDIDEQSLFDYAYLRSPESWRQPNKRPNQIIAVDLFSGCGGLSLGVAEASKAIGRKFLSAGAFDNNATCLAVYSTNFSCQLLCTSDIESILNGELGSAPTVAEHLLTRRFPRVDVLLAGPPCQGYSDLNNYTRRRDPRNKLYERVARFVEIIKPKTVLIENVSAAVHGKEKSIQKSVKIMHELGYNVDTSVVDSTIIGVPQKRKRHILLASRRRKVSIRGILERHRVQDNRSAWWAIDDLVKERSRKLFDSSTSQSSANMKRIRYLYHNHKF